MVNPPNKKSLRDRILNLTQELYDLILDYTFTPSSPEILVTKSPSAFPRLLRVSSSTRRTFASRYYSQVSFTCESPEICKAWLEAIEPAHTHYINEVTYLDPMPEVFIWDATIRMRAGGRLPRLVRKRTPLRWRKEPRYLGREEIEEFMDTADPPQAGNDMNSEIKVADMD